MSSTVHDDVRTDNGGHDSEKALEASNTNTTNNNNDDRTSSSHDDTERARIMASFTPEQERKLIRKIDLALIPWLSILYLLSFLDRTSIGNASLYHMRTDLHLKDQDYLWALTIFFFSYAIFEVCAYDSRPNHHYVLFAGSAHIQQSLSLRHRSLPTFFSSD